MTGTRTNALRAQFPAFGGRTLHYLDSAATAQMPQPVIEAVLDYDTRYRANVHGEVHALACRAVAAYAAARSSVARLLNARSPDEIVFTYGATSAINLLAATFGERLGEGDEIVLSGLEHHSNLIPWQQAARRRGAVLKFLGVTDDGRIDGATLEAAVTERCRLIAVTHCSNVTGAVTDVAPLVRAARAVGARIMLDGAQWIPHGRVDVQALGVDFYAFSGHKLYGPTGIGALWGRSALLAELGPFMTGGQMTAEATLTQARFTDPPQRFEAGTPPIAGAIGLGAAADWVMAQDWAQIRAEEVRLTRRILDALARLPFVRLIGPAEMDARVGVVSFVPEGRDPLALCRALDARDVAVRYGDHCARPLMARMGVEGAVRASLAPYVDDGDVDALLEVLDEARR
jgi:cysteine desulfurase/selenocysteine lyase